MTHQTHWMIASQPYTSDDWLLMAATASAEIAVKIAPMFGERVVIFSFQNGYGFVAGKEDETWFNSSLNPHVEPFISSEPFFGEEPT